MEPISVKPPNVLVFTGEDLSKGQCPWFDNIANTLKFCLHPDCYTVYLLTPSQVVKDPWSDNITLLIVSCNDIDEQILEMFRSYALNGGKLLNFCSNLDLPSLGIEFEECAQEKRLMSIKYKEFKTVSALCGKYHLKCTKECSILGLSNDDNKPVIGKVSMEKGVVLISQVHLEVDPVMLGPEPETFTALKQSNADRLGVVKDILSSEFGLNCSSPDIPKLTPCYLLTNDNTTLQKFVDTMDLKVNDKLQLKFLNMLDKTSLPEATANELPVLYHASDSLLQNVPFNKDTYFSHLKTKTFGQIVYFVDVVGTTMDIVEGIPEWDGAVVTARQQIKGKGRGGNTWISPVGCAMFSTHFTVPLTSPLGKKLPIVQHFAALSIVLGVRKTPGYENVDLRLKWPNDIYYGKHCKIGGILVNSSIQGNCVHVYTGSGINVSNSQPTLCLNDIIQLHNNKTGDELLPFSIEQLISSSLTELEVLIHNCQKNDQDKFLSDYYTYWLHTNQKVTLGDTKETATVLGLDDYGFLLVKTEEGKKIALQPDGNSFDMIKNLIVVKN